MPYSSMEQANPALKGIKPPVTLAQANAIAVIADKVTGVESPWAIAISQFKKSHVAKDGKWVKKEGSEFGGKKKAVDTGPFQCECLECGHKMKSDEHCADIECPECGGDMRRAERPGPGKKAFASGVKAFESDGNQYLWLWTSNAFEDDQREIIATKAWDDYVARCDGSGNRGRVWFWHVKGSDYADVVWQGVEGRILLELAKIDNTEYGRKMFHALQHPEELPGLLPQGWGTSHGFVYKRSSKVMGPPHVYNWVHKFETTTLPFHRASNKLGGIKEVIDMTVSKEKVAGLAAVVGEELAQKMLETAKAAGGDLEQKVAFKEKDDDVEEVKPKAKPAKPIPPFLKKDEDEEDEEVEEEDEDTEEEGKEYYELEMDDQLVKDIASQVPVNAEVKKAIKELLPGMLTQAMVANAEALTAAVKEAVADANVSSKEQIVQQAVAGTLRLKPYVASKADDNTVAEKDLAKHDKAKDKGGDVVSVLARRMLAGTL